MEDNALDQMAVERCFKAENLPYSLVFAETVAAAKEYLEKGGIDIVLIDQNLPDGLGLELQKDLDGIPSIFLTGSEDINIAVQAMKAGAYDYLIKDTAREYLRLLPLSIEKALKNRKDADELEKYRENLKQLVEERTEELRESPTLYKQAERMANMGYWEWDHKSEKMRSCSNQFALIHEMTVADNPLLRGGGRTT